MTTGCIVYAAGCTTRFDNRLNEQWLFVQHGCQTGFNNRLDVCLSGALLGGFAIGAVVALLWQHNANAKC